ncbi:high frequency lysogenization protein HflD [Alishewanella sp. 16-MA]|uniref:High frequency lysogenization protein HflD homolog n=1 Tax=Alishewanella maricola TaxID=2795740 RepID=A0ABS8C3E8_9ALTE|nr:MULTISPECIES: high frequency lysogenization protein HflD [Alishewanella]MDP4946644.1 high frequency lysogenization protein HflD [Alishewanella sp.]MDP5206665.1 high frequency lysogenization protein HflD [Alishewanella sp. SMS9]MCB5226841.1 high frequency lysogenization protein HflD [Alishewanella maricola]MDP5036695.1 high frequency lysogenization protein HflD [Alishewanella sp.]MDP5188162.1 high frequency lysogenization protein HflD [Alishewanella sp.]
MEASLQTQLIALAGLCQAVKLVQTVARSSESQQGQLAIALGSVVNLNPAEPLDIYGGEMQNLRQGFELIIEQLADKPKKDVELTRYLVGVLALERRLNKNSKNMQQLGNQLQQMDRQLQHFTVTDENIIAKLADIYTECISSLGARIQIYGQPDLLSQNSVQHKVRALLLAAVRAAVLWRQAGGSRLHFVFKRRKLLAAAEAALNSI